MGKQERQRKLARERYERQMRRRSQRARRVRQWTVISGAGIAVIVLAVVGYPEFDPSTLPSPRPPEETPAEEASEAQTEEPASSE